MKIYSLILLLVVWMHPKAQDSLTIEQAIHEALSHNYGILISKNTESIGKINNNWANAGAIPTISATANKTIGVSNIQQELNSGNTIDKTGATNQNFNAGLGISWRVFDGFRMYATKKRLEELERNGEYAFRKNADQTVYDVVSQYYNIVKLKEQRKATLEQITLYRDRLKIADMKYNIGSGAKYELLQAKVDLNEQLSTVLNIENQIQLDKVNLSNLIGRKADTAFNVADTIIVNKIPDMTVIEEKLGSQNPDVLLGNSNLAILMQTKREINAGRLPTVTLNGNYNFVRSSNGAGLTLSNQNYGPSAFLGVAVPLFNGGLVRKQSSVEDILIKNQNLTIEQLKSSLHASILNAVINYQNAMHIVGFEQSNLSLASENIYIATERFRMLNITSVELRQIQISYLNAETRLYNALYQAKLAEAEIALLTGEISRL